MKIEDIKKFDAHYYRRFKLVGRSWHRYVVLHKVHHRNTILELIADSEKWCHENIPKGDWLIHLIDRQECSMIWIADDHYAALFEIAFIVDARDRLGKQSY